MEQRAAEGGFSSLRITMMFLVLNIQALLAALMGQCVRIFANVMNDIDAAVAFLLDDLFASKQLMVLMSPSRVVEMFAGVWVSSAAGTGLPTSCIVVSERSLVGAAMALVGVDSLEAVDGLLVD